MRAGKIPAIVVLLLSFFILLDSVRGKYLGSLSAAGEFKIGSEMATTQKPDLLKEIQPDQSLAKQPGEFKKGDEKIKISEPNEVTIATDKQEYGKGENIKITIRNASQESIFSHIGSRTPVFAIEYVWRKGTEGVWEKLYAQCKPPHCYNDTDVPVKIQPGESKIMEWEPRVYVNGTTESYITGAGEYRISILYEDEQKSKWQRVDTNEFKINENSH